MPQYRPPHLAYYEGEGAKLGEGEDIDWLNLTFGHPSPSFAPFPLGASLASGKLGEGERS
jgi:hypothetical protein